MQGIMTTEYRYQILELVLPTYLSIYDIPFIQELKNKANQMKPYILKEDYPS